MESRIRVINHSSRVIVNANIASEDFSRIEIGEVTNFVFIDAGYYTITGSYEDNTTETFSGAVGIDWGPKYSIYIHSGGTVEVKKHDGFDPAQYQ